MKSKGLRNGSLKFRAIDQVKGQFFARKQFQGLAPDVFHDLFSLGSGVTAGANFTQGQVYKKPQVPEIAVLLPNGLP